MDTDTTPPYVTLRSKYLGVKPQYERTVEVDLIFNEPVADLTEATLIEFILLEPYNAGYIHNFRKITSRLYKFDFYFHFPGNVSFDNVADVYTDLAGNNNTAVLQEFVLYFGELPTAVAMPSASLPLFPVRRHHPSYVHSN